MKKILVSILIGVMFISSLSVSASANFSDVKQSDWYYDTVTEMTDKGLFKGKGNNMFCPNDTMTKAEFITVVMRILYPDTDFTSKEGQPWWQSAYDMALAGLITKSEFPVSEIEQTISRQEMALVSSKALMMRGETFFITEDLHKKIPDYNQVGKEYTMYVEMAYSMGILCGVDSSGTFAPLQTLTRAEAATVLYRIVEPSVREKKDFSAPVVVKPNDTQGAITIKEGEKSERRFAKEGDIVIKADGTQVTLKKGAHGILGEGQGVAPDLGVINEGFTVTAKNITGYSYAGGSGFYDSTGFVIKNQNYFINELTGEGHWSVEWEVMTSAPKTSGTFDFQLSSDKNWIWNADTGEWSCAYIQNFSDSVIQIVNQANGL
ncbi:MAG: S-layer homology domain-containing protein [Ruminococcaceae bacterium]|nr:S-layer homology domain-containing protein [Oscillospiraceae bacterium]